MLQHAAARRRASRKTINMASWEDESFELAPLSLEDEDTFVAPRTALVKADDYPHEDLPVLLVDLAALSADQPGANNAAVREQVLERLQADWTANSSELMAAGMCWHAPRAEADERRLAYEAAHPEAALTAIGYPRMVDGVPVTVLAETVMRSTPWEIVDEIKKYIARARRPLKWQADLAVELEEIAEGEAAWSERIADSNRALEAAVTARECTLARMHASHHASNVPLTGNEVTSMLAHLDELSVNVRAAEAACKEAAESDPDGAAPPGEASIVEVILDLVFQQYPRPDTMSFTEHVTEVAQIKHDLTRMWRSTFGRLPVASNLILKHAPARPPPPRGRPRMLVPAPPGAKPRVPPLLRGSAYALGQDERQRQQIEALASQPGEAVASQDRMAVEPRSESASDWF